MPLLIGVVIGNEPSKLEFTKMTTCSLFFPLIVLLLLLLLLLYTENTKQCTFLPFLHHGPTVFFNWCIIKLFEHPEANAIHLLFCLTLLFLFVQCQQQQKFFVACSFIIFLLLYVVVLVLLSRRPCVPGPTASARATLTLGF